MPILPKLGTFYTREQINSMHGGGIQSYLPTKNGRVVCGCFKLDQNPSAPEKVLVGLGTRREETARMAVLQRKAFPVFIKRDGDTWEYVGNYLATRYLERGHRLLETEELAIPEGIAGILYMEPSSASLND